MGEEHEEGAARRVEAARCPSDAMDVLLRLVGRVELDDPIDLLARKIDAPSTRNRRSDPPTRRQNPKRNVQSRCRWSCSRTRHGSSLCTDESRALKRTVWSRLHRETHRRDVKPSSSHVGAQQDALERKRKRAKAVSTRERVAGSMLAENLSCCDNCSPLILFGRFAMVWQGERNVDMKQSLRENCPVQLSQESRGFRLIW